MENIRRTLLPLLIVSLVFSGTVQAKPTPGVAGTLSVIPGLGQVTNGDTLEGLAWLTTVVTLSVVKNPVARKFGMNLWMYNTYDAYRDAGATRTQKNSVFGNYIANFNPLYAFDPIGTPILGLAALSPGTSESQKGTPHSAIGRAFYYSSVGLGEEALFRGFLFPAFSEGLGTKWGGAALSSAIFSAAHGQGGAAFVFRFLAGMLFCWQVDRHKYDLRPSIFAHSWFDFLLTRKGNVKAEVEWKAVVKHEFRF